MKLSFLFNSPIYVLYLLVALGSPSSLLADESFSFFGSDSASAPAAAANDSAARFPSVRPSSVSEDEAPVAGEAAADPHADPFDAPVYGGRKDLEPEADEPNLKSGAASPKTTGELLDSQGKQVGIVKQVQSENGLALLVVDPTGKPLYYNVPEEGGDGTVFRRYKVMGPEFKKDIQYEGTSVVIDEPSTSGEYTVEQHSDKTMFNPEKVTFVPTAKSEN